MAGRKGRNLKRGPRALPALPNLPDEMMSVRTVAARLDVCTETVYRLCASGELPHTRVGSQIRIAPAGLAAWLARSV